MVGVLGKHGVVVVDHSMDHVHLHNMGRGSLKHGSISTITTGDDLPANNRCFPIQLETPEERTARRRSHWVIYCLVFVVSVSISISLGVWPYLHEELVPSLTKESLGWVIAAHPFGQMVAAPLLGLWTNKMGSIRAACITTVFLFIAGNIMYAMLGVFTGVAEMAPYYAMILSRFIVGASTGSITLCWSYLASSTTLEERTLSLTLVFTGQACGLVIGPVIQSLITLALPEDVESSVEWFKWSKYTVTTLVSATMGVINLVILLPCVFQEYNMSEKERAMMKASSDTDELIQLPKPDYGALGGVLYARFGIFFVAVLIETLAVPMVMDQYAWSENRAMIIVGMALSTAGVLNIGMYVLSGILSKKVDERLILLALGMLPIVIGMFLFLPWGHNPIPIQKCDVGNETTSVTSITETSTVMDPVRAGLLSSSFNEGGKDCSDGCPEVQEWCSYTPQLPEVQFMIAYFVALAGFPVAQSVMLVIYSKMLGTKPQGVWMGVIGAAGSFSRITGPIIASYVYSELGTRWCFGMLTVVTAAAFLEMTLLYQRLVPLRVPTQVDNEAYKAPAAHASKI